MAGETKADEFFELAKYFEKEGATVKGNMLRVVPWLITFSIGLTGIAVKEGVFQEPPPPDLWASFVFAVGGLLTALLAIVVTVSFGQHMSRNWNRADAAKNYISHPPKLEEQTHPYLLVLDAARQHPTSKGLPSMAWVLLAVVFLLVVISLVVVSKSWPCR